MVLDNYSTRMLNYFNDMTQPNNFTFHLIHLNFTEGRNIHDINISGATLVILACCANDGIYPACRTWVIHSY